MHTPDHFVKAQKPIKRRYDVVWRDPNDPVILGRRVVKATDALAAMPATRHMRGVPWNAIILHVELIR